MKNVFISSILLALVTCCNPAFADGGRNYEECPAPTVIYEKAEAADCPYVERTEKVYVNTEVVVDREAYVLGLVGTGFSSTTGETDYGSVHNRDSHQPLEMGSDTSLRTLAIGYESRRGPFDFYEYGVTTGDSGFRSSNHYTDDLGLNARTTTLEAFAQGKKTFLEYGSFSVHGLAGVGLRSVSTEILERSQSNSDSNNYMTPTLRAGLGLSYNLSNRVAIVARGMWNHELDRGDDVEALDRCWNDAFLTMDDDDTEASVGLRISF